MLACGDGSNDLHRTDLTDPAVAQTGPTTNRADPTTVQTVEECLNRTDIRLVTVHVSGGGGHLGSGVLEQLVLEKELVVRAALVDVEFQAVENEAISFELRGYSSGDETYKYTLLIEVVMRAHEYLRGEGPSVLNAVIESQVVFDSLEDLACAKRVFEADVGQLFSSDEGIALLESTSDPNLYHMGVALEHFKGERGRHSTWLPGKAGSFYNRSFDGWIDLVEVRRRVSSVLEEYNRRDDDRWRNCVLGKFWSKDRDPWAYRGILLPYHLYRDHQIIFSGEHVPVSAGTMIWISPSPNLQDSSGRRLSIRRSMSLEGTNAELFDVSYHSEYTYIPNEWVATSGGPGHYLAVWHKPPGGNSEPLQTTAAGHVITAVKHLREGEYRFSLRIEYHGDDFVDCGQDADVPRRFTVFVDKDRSVGE